MPRELVWSHDRVTAIYVHPSALLLPTADTTSPDDHVEPGAPEAVRHLVEAGFDVVLLAPEGGHVPDLPVDVQRASELPEHLDQDTWYLTGEPHPTFGRPRGGTTVLVGPRRPPGKLPLPRFDLEARDMASAAMEILTRDAMA
jgi:hypothetical protein